MWGDMGSMMGWGTGWGLFGALHMVLWWGLILLGIVALGKWLLGGSGGAARAGTTKAIEILGERYARGEIGKDEFEQKKRDLAQ